MAARRKAELTWNTLDEDRTFLRAMASDVAGSDRSRKRAAVVLAMLSGRTIQQASASAGVTVATGCKIVDYYNDGGWRGLLIVQSPRGGDFLARYDQGYWAERLTKDCLNQSRDYRAIPYGTSRNEPFFGLQTFRDHTINEFLLQSWSGKGRWKRPDLLCIPRDLLRKEKGNDHWEPDLKHLDNENCQPYVGQAAAAIEVETSLWEVRKATVSLSFTVKQEDLQSLRSWVKGCRVPLFIIQVFYDVAYVLPFATLEHLIRLRPTNPRHVPCEVDRITNKPTYKVPLAEGVLLGEIPEPQVEGRVFKAPNGRVTVYGSLSGSAINVSDKTIIEQIVSGRLDASKK